MRWKKNANIIIVCILSLAYTIVTLLNIIGPLHMNAAGSMNQLGMLSIYSLVYCGLALLLTWTIYFKFNDKPELLFFLIDDTWYRYHYTGSLYLGLNGFIAIIMI